MRRCEIEFECKGNCWVNVGGSQKAWDIVSRHCNGSIKNKELINKALHESLHREHRTALCDKLNIQGDERTFLIEKGLKP